MAYSTRSKHKISSRYSQALRALAIATPAAMLILIAVGGVVRVTGSGLGCPSWPLCEGELLPPLEVAALIEFSHRLMAAVVAMLVVSTAAVALRGYRHDRGVWMPAVAALGILIIQIGLGAVTVFLELLPAVVAAHLGTALALLACVLTLSIHILDPRATLSMRYSGALAPLALAVAASVFVLLILGAVVTSSQASLACDGWPLCGGHAAPTSGAALQMAHRMVALLSGVLVAWLAFEAWRVRAMFPEVWAMTVNLAGLFAAQSLIGGINVLTQLAPLPRGLHVVFGSMVWGLAVVVAVFVIRQGTTVVGEKRSTLSEPAPPLGFDHGRPG